MNDGSESSAIDEAVAALYAASLADFIRARDALAKELRSSGERAAASSVKSLRKPSRLAWALDRVAHGQPEVLTALATAVAGIVDAHAGSGDVRAAMTTLRGAVRDFARQAAEEARRAELNLDIGELSNAILAVLGNPASYDELRSGRLAEIPEAGGLDFLTSLPARPKLEVSSPAPATRDAASPAEVAAARAQAARTTAELKAARDTADAAAAALSEAETEFSVAQEKVRLAESEMNDARQRREFARRAHDAAAAELRKAEAASQAAERQLRAVDST